MTVLLQALRVCRVHIAGPLKHVGVTSHGEARTEYPIVTHPPGAFFRAEARVAEMLRIQKLAEETVGPSYIRPLLAIVLDVGSALEAASAVLSAPIPRPAEVLAPGSSGLHAYRPVRTVEEAERTFIDNVEPVFRVEQVTGAARLSRYCRWHAGAIIEIPVN